MTPADALLADQAWALYCRGAEIAAIAEALKRTPDDVARWLAGRVPEGSDIQTERHHESLRGQLRALNADLPNMRGSARAAALRSIERIESQLYASERAASRGPARAADAIAAAPPAFRDVDTIRKAATTPGLRQCRYIDLVALRLGTSGERLDLTDHVAWLREKAARDCIGCPSMRRTHRCSSCGRMSLGARCSFHPDAPLEAVPQPFKWCLTVAPGEVADAMHAMRDNLPEQYFAPVSYHQRILADRGLGLTATLDDAERRHGAMRRELQKVVRRLEDGAATPALLDEFRALNRLMNETADLVVDLRARMGVAGVAAKPGAIVNHGNLAILNARSETNVAIGGDAADRLADAMRRNPNAIGRTLELVGRLTSIMDGDAGGEEPTKAKEIVDVAGGPARKAGKADRKKVAPRRAGPARAAAGRVGKARGARDPGRAPKAASA